MRVLRIIARLNVGGPARHVAWLTAGLRDAGHESVLVAGTVPPGEDDMSYFAARQGVEPVIIPEMSREISPKDAVTVWKLYRLFRRLRPDVVHTHTAKAGTVGRCAGLLYKWLTPAALAGRPRACRFVHTYHGHVFHSYYGAAKTRLFLAVERALARIATDVIVVISPQQLAEINGRFGVGRPAQFRIVPLGLDAAVFSDSRARRRAARAGLGVADDEALLVGIVGRLTEIKNHRLFLEAAALLKARLAARREGGDHGAARPLFFVVGDGHLRLDLETHACALGLADDVTFTGTLDDPENFYAALDVVALTSLNEGTPLTLIEAMASERAVAATAVGGVVDLLGGVEASELRRPAAWRVCARGVQVEPGDAEAFSHALEHLADHPELRAAMGARGRAFVERNYSKERLVEDVLGLYENLLATRAPGRREGAGTSGDIGRAAARVKGD
ncbi:MAG TPA: glycosyltransferase [Pyrinomonadaceae bacterium]|jgi:glycosyltransferase involved in cell wall biosynthesis